MIRALVIFLLVASGSALADDWADELRATTRVEPTYPYLAAATGMTAVCRAAYGIDENGRPFDVCVACNTGLERPTPPRTQTLVSQQFVQSVEVAISQWAYSPDLAGYIGVRTEIQFLLADQSPDVLPEPPAMDECRGPQIT
ncbi:hypothetical protein [Maricaulis sp.]|uniref:hypothetical protein n=1 Tax=Maricaulis sp. TaxID=1486257 RepID=UPI0025E607FE|nr:hypothetical protein [Maricaulis sp.]MDF1767762.1 hypothetical protein [Maricaulis sp.]